MKRSKILSRAARGEEDREAVTHQDGLPHAPNGWGSILGSLSAPSRNPAIYNEFRVENELNLGAPT